MQRVKKTLQGKIKLHPKGFGLLLPPPSNPRTPPLGIKPENLWGLMEGDLVLVKVSRRRFRHFSLQAKILKVLQRKHSHIIGIYQKRTTTEGWIKSSRPLWKGDLLVKTTKESPLERQWVLVRILHYPPPCQKRFEGRIEQILGKKLHAKEDLLRVTIECQLPRCFPEFPEETQNLSLKKDSPSEKDVKKRKNLQHLSFCTVDGETAKDFDDAICVERTKEGFMVFVAIADVSAYVNTNSSIDKEAFKRGTSVYFANEKPIPMLPPILSENLCSLIPQKVRLVMVAEMHFHPSGKLRKSQFYPASIKSRVRLTYKQVQSFLDNGQTRNASLKMKPEVLKSLTEAANLTKLLLKEKEKRGALHFDNQNSLLHIDSTGNPVDFIENKTLFSHQIIEEFMIVANTQVAFYLSKKQKSQILRVHEMPKKESLSTLHQQLLQLGLPSQELKSIFSANSDPTSLFPRLQDLLTSIQKNESLAHMLLLRCMKKAIYSTNIKIGHFGLALDTYTHFTSPIRRYTDLVVHRILKNTLENTSPPPYTKEELQHMAYNLSECEQKAVQAERLFDAMKKARWAQNHTKKVFQTIVSSVTHLGIFTFIPKYDLHGLIQRRHLEERGFYFDEEKSSFIHYKVSMSYVLGDQIDIKIENADIETGKIDFAFAEEITLKRKPAQNPKFKRRNKSNQTFRKRKRRKR